MKRKTYLNQFNKNRKRVVFLREEKGLSFAKIGAKLNPPVSRQAAAKVYKRATENDS